MEYQEINFDGIVGPTHNYAGLSLGNIASMAHGASPSNPKAAALQGLLKAKTLADWGFPQAVFPPHQRPHLHALRGWGITGSTDRELLQNARKADPLLLAAVFSASSMWTANACTMAPSPDTLDERCHFTPANLSSKLHRSLEASFTHRLLRTIFQDEEYFKVHPPLVGGESMADEGAANHTRLAPEYQARGLHLFVYGRSSLHPPGPTPTRYPARQTRESFEAIARLHHLPGNQVLSIRQSPTAIDAGVFHNDVIAVGNKDVLILHEDAFCDQARAMERIRSSFSRLHESDLRIIIVPGERISLEEAVRTYLFNSQLLALPRGRMLLAVPSECLESSAVSELLSEWVESRTNPVKEVVSFNLRESMRNGGGPACLRQRIVLSTRERKHMRGRLFLDHDLYVELVKWVEHHYRDQLMAEDLADPQLVEESYRALDELAGILQLPSIYPFQQ